jgi:hypothetical protein
MICVCRPLVWCINSFACLLLYSRWLCTLESRFSLSNLQNKMLMCTLLCGGHMAVVLLYKKLLQSLLHCRVATSCCHWLPSPRFDAKDLLRECCLLWTVRCAVWVGVCQSSSVPWLWDITSVSYLSPSFGGTHMVKNCWRWHGKLLLLLFSDLRLGGLGFLPIAWSL